MGSSCNQPTTLARRFAACTGLAVGSARADGTRLQICGVVPGLPPGPAPLTIPPYKQSSLQPRGHNPTPAAITPRPQTHQLCSPLPRHRSRVCNRLRFPPHRRGRRPRRPFRRLTDNLPGAAANLAATTQRPPLSNHVPARSHPSRRCCAIAPGLAAGCGVPTWPRSPLARHRFPGLLAAAAYRRAPALRCRGIAPGFLRLRCTDVTPLAADAASLPALLLGAVYQRGPARRYRGIATGLAGGC